MNSNGQAAQKLNVYEKHIREWQKQEKMLLKVPRERNDLKVTDSKHSGHIWKKKFGTGLRIKAKTVVVYQLF